MVVCDKELVPRRDLAILVGFLQKFSLLLSSSRKIDEDIRHKVSQLKASVRSLWTKIVDLDWLSALGVRERGQRLLPRAREQNVMLAESEREPQP